jgi:hypothetical protein
MYLLFVVGQDEDDEPESTMNTRVAVIPQRPGVGRLSRAEADELRREFYQKYAVSLTKTHGLNKHVAVSVAEWLLTAAAGDYLLVPAVQSCPAMTLILLDGKRAIDKTWVVVEKMPVPRLVRNDDDEADDDAEEEDPGENRTYLDEEDDDEDPPRKKPPRDKKKRR